MYRKKVILLFFVCFVHFLDVISVTNTPIEDNVQSSPQCVCNGVSYEKVCGNVSEVEALEMFFSGFPRMVRLSLFPRLLTLTIVGQNVHRIQGLDDCPLLQELWVAECQLTVSFSLKLKLTA